MKAKLWLLFASLLFASSFMGLVSAQTGQVYLKEDFDYSSLDQMQAAGWAFTRPEGISVASSAVTLDGTGGDCAISRSTSFSDDGLNWKAEVKAMWLGQGHSVLSVFVGTAEHSYGWAADGYYKEFSFYRDSQKILHFGNYAEKAGEYVTLTMIREGNTFSFYFNGNLINTYTEQDTTPSKVTSLGLVSPWRGDAKYDYYQIGEPNAVVVPSNPSEVTSSFPLVPVLIGGGITAAVVGGIVVYYFFIAGGSSASAGASAGVSSAGTGNSGSGGQGGGSLIHEQPISPLSGEAPISPLAGDSEGPPQLIDPETGEPAQLMKPNVEPEIHPIVDINGNPVIEGPIDPETGEPAQLMKPNVEPEIHPAATLEEAIAVDQQLSQQPTNANPSAQSGTANPQNSPNPQSYTPLVTITGTDFGDARSVNLKKAQTDSKTGQTEESSESKSTS